MILRLASQFFSLYGMSVVLLLVCVYFSWATLQSRPLAGTVAARDVAQQIAVQTPWPSRVLIVDGNTPDDAAFSGELEKSLRDAGVTTISRADGEPRPARHALQAMIDANMSPDVIASTGSNAEWLPSVLAALPQAARTPVLTPRSELWPTFLRADNLLNVANQIVVIAIIAVGMTLVIITGGIDLSVGSLVALSAVAVGIMIRDVAGGTGASPLALVGCCVAAVLMAGAIGAFSGVMITLCRVPPFIATLAIMKVASGLAYIASSGQTIYDVPQSFTWLGRGSTWGVPNAVALMAGIFAVAHVVMSRTWLGRYFYAVGGNVEAARLSGVRVKAVIVAAYVISGLTAGVGGIVVASQLKSSSPTYGLGYELSVIAAVVLGGTSLAGGSGRVLGTLIGALIIAVIQNGMNLTGVESYSQGVVLGLVILGAVLLDTAKKARWRLPRWLGQLTPRKSV